ncbi:DUF397 domain-containing protein [Thermopolyspora sp. NPDC052614]|uniref:DUF397 domain-containing protein n=1 Tax=Thermopolyspora sp. NPDC052614 TaxID=3155682 RepID=UPI00341F1E93
MTHPNAQPEYAALVWRRSSYSNTQGNQCVEIAAFGERVAIRDSKDPNNSVLTFSKAEWETFVRSQAGAIAALPPQAKPERSTQTIS